MFTPNVFQIISVNKAIYIYLGDLCYKLNIIISVVINSCFLLSWVNASLLYVFIKKLKSKEQLD